MGISPVCFGSTSYQKTLPSKVKSQNPYDNLTPVQKACVSGVTWFGMGFLFDKFLGVCSKNLKTPMKLSLGINGAIGLISGIVTYYKAKKG